MKSVYTTAQERKNKSIRSANDNLANTYNAWDYPELNT